MLSKDRFILIPLQEKFLLWDAQLTCTLEPLLQLEKAEKAAMRKRSPPIRKHKCAGALPRCDRLRVHRTASSVLEPTSFCCPRPGSGVQLWASGSQDPGQSPLHPAVTAPGAQGWSLLPPAGRDDACSENPWFS